MVLRMTPLSTLMLLTVLHWCHCAAAAVLLPVLGGAHGGATLILLRAAARLLLRAAARLLLRAAARLLMTLLLLLVMPLLAAAPGCCSPAAAGDAAAGC